MTVTPINIDRKYQQDQKIHDVFVFLEIFSQEGGVQSYVKDIFQGCSLLNESYEADIFILRDSPKCENPFASNKLRFHYFQSSSANIGRVKLAYSLLKFLWKNKPQRVFCGHIKLAVLVQTICQLLAIPYTVLTYGKEVWDILPRLEKNALASANKIWFISTYTRDKTLAANNFDINKAEIIPCTIDSNKFTPGTKSPELLLKYGLDDARVLMTVARLWSGDIYKGVDVTIRALPQILKLFPDVKYLVIGRGDDQARLAQLAVDLGVSDRVIFAGFVPTEELVVHYRLADGYIMPSQEGFGIVYLEAMACGVPVLSGDDDGSCDPLQDGKLGWRVPHRDVDAVAAGCIKILQGDDQRCDGKWLREQVISLFGMETFHKRLRKMLLHH